jgi:hypothetical protein
MGKMEPVILAVDPGRGKCGVAVVSTTAVLARDVVSIVGLGDLFRSLRTRFAFAEAVVGDRTGAGDVVAAIRRELPDVHVTLADEAGTTLEARRLYFAEHPPRGWRRLLPLSLLVPPEPYDDYAAVALARRAASGVPANFHGTSPKGEDSRQGRSIPEMARKRPRGSGKR